MEMWSAKLTSSAHCSDFLPNPDSRSTETDLYWRESPPLRTSQRNPFACRSAPAAGLVGGPGQDVVWFASGSHSFWTAARRHLRGFRSTVVALVYQFRSAEP